MGILSRFSEIMKANINDLLDKCEDPEKMIDQTLRDLIEQKAEVKKETAGIMAEEDAAERRVKELQQAIADRDAVIDKCIAAGDDDGATKVITKKQELEAQLQTAMSTYQLAKQRSEQMQQMYQKLSSDISNLEGRRQNIKAQVSMAKAQERMNNIAGKVNASGSLDAFNRMEAKAQKMLDQAQAGAELTAMEDGLSGGDDDIMKKYSTGSSSAAAELARRKAAMGINN